MNITAHSNKIECVFFFENINIIVTVDVYTIIYIQNVRCYMTKEDRIVYEAYLKTDEWENKRKQKAEQQNYKCEICGKIVLSGYHIHHKTYKNFMNEPLSDLQFLCEDCHKEIHKEKHERVAYGVVNKPKEKKQSVSNKGCNYCKYSCCQHYTGVDRYVLWCNKLYEECPGKRCEHFRNGSYKEAKQKYWKKKLR